MKFYFEVYTIAMLGINAALSFCILSKHVYKKFNSTKKEIERKNSLKAQEEVIEKRLSV